MLAAVKPHAIGILIGFIGLLFVLVGYHLYLDHQNLHALIQWAPSVEQRLKK